MLFENRSALPAHVSSAAQVLVAPSYDRPVLLVVAEPSAVHAYPASPYARFAVHSAADALRLLKESRPHVLAIDWDVTGFDGPALCRSAGPGTAILVTTGRPEDAPAAMKAGCHSILLKPLSPSLTAGRIGRLVREISARSMVNSHTVRPLGTNRRWEDEACPRCGVPGATGFDFSSHRRAWYGCLSCDSVWVGRRRE